MKVVSAPCMWSPCCIFVNREPRWQQCSNDMADRAKQRNDGLEDQAIDAPSVQNIIRSGGQMKIAFLGVRVPGHLNPMTTLARKLKARVMTWCSYPCQILSPLSAQQNFQKTGLR
jgi:hypothetical protein